MSEDIRIALVLGSTRPGRFCGTVATWTEEAVERAGGFTPEMVDPAALDLPVRHPREQQSGVADLRGRMLGTATFMFAVPYAYGALRPTGAAYLLWLAWQALRPG